MRIETNNLFDKRRDAVFLSHRVAVETVINGHMTVLCWEIFLMIDSLLFAQASASNSDAESGAAILGCLLIFGGLCAICNALGKKKTYDVRGTVRER